MEAKNKSIIAQEKDAIVLAYSALVIDERANRIEITSENFEAELKKNGNNVTVEEIENEDTGKKYFKITFLDTKHIYLVDKKGNITYLDDKEIDTSEIDFNLVLQNIDYSDSTNAIMNPDRGLYIPVLVRLTSDGSFKYEQELAIDRIQGFCTQAKDESIQIIQLRIDIGQLSGNCNSNGVDKSLTTTDISSLNDIINVIRENNLNVIIRFAYDFDGNIGREPKSFSTITNHINQLKSFFETNKDIISTVEAGFLGPWGEMHDAGAYQADNYYKSLIQTLLNNTPSKMKINVRKPYFYKLAVGNLSNSQIRLGIFNDGYLGNETDLGTFDNGISRKDFVNWMQEQGKYTLYGGEVTKNAPSVSTDEKWSESNFAIEEMPKTHTSYLNSQYNTSILEGKWKSQTYTNSGSEYNGKTAYKYITDHLGYRLVVRSSKISASVKKGEIAGVNLEIENVGFGNIVKNQKVTVLLRKDNIYYETKLDVSTRNINSGETSDLKYYFYVPSDIESGEWKVYLKFANNDNEDYAIQFANPGVWDEDLLANNIGKIEIENEVAKEGIKFKQAFKSFATDGIKGTVTKRGKKMSITFAYYNEATVDPSGNTPPLSTAIKTITSGTTIDFTNASELSNIGISIPNGYTFSYAQCYDITGDWDRHNSITIPNSTSVNKYWINVFLREEGKIPVTVAFYRAGNSSPYSTKEIYVNSGTIIDFKNSSNLSNLGISIPNGYTFDYAQCFNITGDWNGYNSITIPSNSTTSGYYINVYIK